MERRMVGELDRRLPKAEYPVITSSRSTAFVTLSMPHQKDKTKDQDCLFLPRNP